MTKLYLFFWLLLSTSISCTQQSSIESMLDKVDMLFVKKKYNEAVKAYTQVISQYPTVELAYFNRGKCLVNLKRYTEALEDFDFLLRNKQPPTGLTYAPNRNSPNVDYKEKLIIQYTEALFERAVAKYYMDSLQGSIDDFM